MMNRKRTNCFKNEYTAAPSEKTTIQNNFAKDRLAYITGLVTPYGG